MKKILSFIVALAIVIVSLPGIGYTLVEKKNNRYYMLQKELERLDQNYDLQVYGSCHAYTSYNPTEMVEKYKIQSYVFASPSEIIPSTYVRMDEQFKKYAPKVALVEIWGTNPYETYIATGQIFDSYFKTCLEIFPLSKAKIEVLADYEQVELLSEGFLALKYKSRLGKGELKEVDWAYSLEALKTTYDSTYNLEEMQRRFSHYGYLAYTTSPLRNYDLFQADVADDEYLEVEPDIMKYVDKIIDLCDRYGVTLVFYRAPYRSTENELKKANYLEKYFAERDIPFYDLEKLISFDDKQDFSDYEHLSMTGAQKATEFINHKILHYFLDSDY